MMVEFPYGLDEVGYDRYLDARAAVEEARGAETVYCATCDQRVTSACASDCEIEEG